MFGIKRFMEEEMWNWRIAFVIVLVALPNLAVAGPFGLEMGMSHQVITADAEEIAPNVYRKNELPKKSTLFEIYIVQSTSETGLCYLKGVGKDIRVNDFGSAMRSEFEGLVRLLERKYGTPQKQYDFVRDGSIGDDPEDFMMSLYKGDRFLAALWENSEAQSLPDSLQTIGVGASALSTNTGYIWLEYYFLNHDECQRIIEAKKSDVP